MQEYEQDQNSHLLNYLLDESILEDFLLALLLDALDLERLGSFPVRGSLSYDQNLVVGMLLS